MRLNAIRNLAKALLFAMMLGGTTGAMLAQSTTQGAISGTIFDATDAVVPKATVTIHNAGTNAEVVLTSDDSGFFKAPQLAPGTYTVTISAAGFSELRSTGLVVEVNLVTELNPHL